MAEYSAYMGKVVMLDLAAQETSVYPWSDGDRERYIGGSAMAAKIFADSKNAADLIVIATGPLTGTGAPGSNHFDISAVSPLTGEVSHASCGGNFGFYLKKAGIDALVIKGSCESPMWLEIANDRFTLHKAGSIWGKTVSSTNAFLQAEMDEQRNCHVKCGMLAIGPAGENLVNYASVASGDRDAYHCSVGAVFGGKKLKAIVASGNKEISVFDAEKALINHKKWSNTLHAHPLTGKLLPKQGTMGFVERLQETGLLPTENFSKASRTFADDIGGAEFADKFNVVNRGCTYCPIRCERSVMLDDELVKGPDLDAAVLLGSNILNNDAKLIVRWTKELHELGLDLAHTAKTVAWAMQARTEGIWKTGLEFGKTSNLSETFAAIALKKGVGEELAEGYAALGKKYGGDFAYMFNDLVGTAARSYIGFNGKLAGYIGSYLNAAENAGQCRYIALAMIPAVMIEKPKSTAAAALRILAPLTPAGAKLVSVLPEALGDKLPLTYLTRELRYSVGMKKSLDEFVKAGAAEGDTELPKPMAAAYKAANAFSLKDCAAKLRAAAEKISSMDKDEIPVLKLLKKEA